LVVRDAVARLTVVARLAGFARTVLLAAERGVLALLAGVVWAVAI
jgi:hypothetical protein